MTLIAKQPYVKIQRKISSTHQEKIEEARMIYLYQDKVKTKHREFPLDHVLDVSYRKISGVSGLLYIHTNSGLFSYFVKTSTTHFIRAFKSLKGK